MPMHRKRARLHHCLIYVDLCSLLNHKSLLIKWNKESLRDKMKPDPAFATSPICVPDKDYEFSVDPDIITLVECGYESETVVAHLTKLNDIATLFTNDERTRYFYIIKG